MFKKITYLLLLFILFIPKSLSNEVKYQKIQVNSVSDIYKKIEGLYTFSKLNINLSKLSSTQRKKAFIHLLLPSIKVVQQKILNDKNIVKNLKYKSNLSKEETLKLKNIFKKYDVSYKNFKELESRMIIYPTSLILSQAAIESGWGTSRFFKEGNNIFGIWAGKNTPCIKAKKSKVCVRKFESLDESIEYFVLMLSKKVYYAKVRQLTLAKNSPYQIASGLTKYSGVGYKYVTAVRNMMRANNLEQYDKVIPYK